MYYFPLFLRLCYPLIPSLNATPQNAASLKTFYVIILCLLLCELT